MPHLTLFRFRLRPVGVSYSGSSSSICKNLLSASSHCSNNADDGMRISVLTCLCAMTLQHTTVFPNAVAAFRIPLSYWRSFPIADICDSFSSPVNSAWIGRPMLRLSSISYSIPAFSHSFVIFSKIPLRHSQDKYICNFQNQTIP